MSPLQQFTHQYRISIEEVARIFGKSTDTEDLLSDLQGDYDQALSRDLNAAMHDLEGHLRIAIEALQTPTPQQPSLTW